MSQRPDYRLEQSVGFLISSTHRLLRPPLQARLRGSGVAYGMWFFLRVLWEEDGISQREIAARVKLSPPTVVTALRRLQKAKMVTLRTDPADGRRMRIFLTEKGKKLQDALLPRIEEINRIALRGLSKDDVAQLRRILGAIQANLA